jgi:hypothetical protein
MKDQTAVPLDFSTRLRRSEGRGGRVHAASVKLTQEELAELERTAKDQQKAVGEWAREVLLREVRRGQNDPVFTEIVATRMLLNLVLKHVACGEVMTAETFSAVLTKVRTTKHKQALDMMDQYAAPDQKES